MNAGTLRTKIGLSQRSTWLLEIGPVAVTILLLSVKTMYASLSLAGLWWAPQEPLADWIRGHPQLFTASVGASVLLLCPAMLLARASRYALVVLLNFLVSTVIIADMVHADYYGDVPSVLIWSSFPMVPGLVQSLVALLRPLDVLYYIDIAIAVVLGHRYLRACRACPALDSGSRARVSLGLFIGGLALMVPTSRVVLGDANGLFAVASLQRDVYAQLGVVPYHVVDAAVHLRSAESVTEADCQRVARYLDGLSERRDRRSELFGVARGRNLIVILAESLQGFPLDTAVRGQLLTPNLAAIAHESLYFVDFYEQTHLGTTADGEFASFQSLHPLPVGVVANQRHSNRFRALPHALLADGYSAFSAVAEPGHFWNMNRMHPALGFQRSYFEDHYSVGERIGEWLADHEFFSQTLPLLEAEKQPFMAYLLTSSNHHPWGVPAQYKHLELGELEGTPLGDYLQSVHYFDRSIGKFVDGLRRTGILDRSVLVVMGDHQAFLKPADLGLLLGFPPDRADQYILLRKKVPLVIRLPEGKLAGVRTVTGGQLDLAPTLLALLGISDPASVTLGNDLTLGEDSLVVFRDGSFTEGPHYVLNRFGPPENSSCYEKPGGRPIACSLLNDRRLRAREQLEISDLILRGNLIDSAEPSGRMLPVCSGERGTGTRPRPGLTGAPDR